MVSAQEDSLRLLESAMKALDGISRSSSEAVPAPAAALTPVSAAVSLPAPTPATAAGALPAVVAPAASVMPPSVPVGGSAWANAAVGSISGGVGTGAGAVTAVAANGGGGVLAHDGSAASAAAGAGVVPRVAVASADVAAARGAGAGDSDVVGSATPTVVWTADGPPTHAEIRESQGRGSRDGMLRLSCCVAVASAVRRLCCCCVRLHLSECAACSSGGGCGVAMFRVSMIASLY
jgi:hypothetical protein